MALLLNLSWVTPLLAVGARFETDDIPELAALQIRAVVDLRIELCDDEALLRTHGVTFLRLPTQDQCAVSQPMLRDGVEFVNAALDRGERVLIHCEHGVGRSVTLALCVLVSRGMAPLDALELVKSKRWQASPSPAQYHAFAEWLAERSVEVPHFDAFAAIAYRHLHLRGM